MIVVKEPSERMKRSRASSEGRRTGHWLLTLSGRARDANASNSRQLDIFQCPILLALAMIDFAICRKFYFENFLSMGNNLTI